MLTGVLRLLTIQDNIFWMTLTNIFPGQYSLGLLMSTTAIPKGSAGIFSVQMNPSTTTLSKSCLWCQTLVLIAMLLILVLELKTYLFPLLSLEGWNVEAKVAQFESYVKDHLRFYKDQVRTDTTM